MLQLAWRLARGYRLRPWRSPYLRWRIETYSGIHADQISFAEFWRFIWRRRADLARYLLWAEAERRSSRKPPSSANEDQMRHSCQSGYDG